ncbi:recombinase family protein [Litoreibacter albidus]|uniref:recombinase family protein n=1 Tax=Litoreibacter albidus TaxID=670155 RepID=UPI003735AC64
MNTITDIPGHARIKHFIGLIRVSTRRQADENLSLEVQEQRIRSFVENTPNATLNLHIETQSASKLSARRSVLKAALEEARTTKGTLVVVRIDRLSRNMDVLPLLKGVRIYSLDQGFVAPKRLKELVAEAHRESKVISDAARISAAERRAKGQLLGNRSTLHIAQRNGCVRNKARADNKVQRLVDIFRTNSRLQSLTHRELSLTLNSMGFFNQVNGSETVPWTKGSIRAPRAKAMKILMSAQI